MSTTVRNTVETKFTATDMASGRFSRMRRSAEALRRSVVAAGKGMAIVGVASAGAALAGVAAFNRLRGTMDTVAARLDTMAKFSRQVDISAKALHRLEVASGFVEANFDTVRGGIEKFSVSMSALRRGTGPMKKFLEDTSPAFARQLANTENNTEALEAYFGYLAALPASERMAAASAGVGRGAAGDFVRYVMDGAETLEAVLARADRVRPFQDAGDEAETYNDAWLEFGLTIEGVKDQLTVGLFPVMTDFALRFASYIQDNRDKIDQWVAGIEGWIARIDPERVAASIERLFQLMDGGIAVVGTLASAFGGLADAVGGADKALYALLTTWAAFKARGLIGGAIGVMLGGGVPKAPDKSGGGGVMPWLARLAPALSVSSSTRGNEWMNATPEARADWHREMRAQIREQSRPVPTQYGDPFAPSAAQRIMGTVSGMSRPVEAKVAPADAAEMARQIAAEIRGTMDMNITVRATAGTEVVRTGTTKSSPLVGNVGVTTPNVGPQ